MSQSTTWQNATTTTDPPASILVRIHEDEGYIVVTEPT